MTTSRPTTATILFSDLVNSTELLQRVGDATAQRVFEAHHRLLRDAVAAHGGDEVKWTGDGLMVAFDSATAAVRCAIAMQHSSRRPAAGERLQIRVGLQVGEALRHDATDYFGTTVVVASRLCALAGAGEILCTATVRALISDASAFDFHDRGALALKGIAAPVDACEVLYEHDPLAMLAVTPFVGRDDVIASLTAKLEDARAGRGSLVMLVGEPGIGKTRTAEEFAAVARHKGATVLWGRCYDGEWAPPFSPFVEAIKEYAAATPPDRLAATLGPDAGILVRIVPALREFLPDIVEPPAMPAETERYRLLEAATNLFAKIASTVPLVLMLDDLHWADKGTIAMLRQVARQTSSHAVVIIGGYRDVELDRQHPLAAALGELRRETSFERIALKGLDANEVGELFDVIAEQDVPRPLVDAIAAETNGNPFFIKEVLLHLIEEQKIVQEDGRWTPKLSIAEIGIPEGVREVIGRRLSRLSDSCNAMLASASAMTGGFSWAELQAICEEPERSLLDALEEALRAQVLVETANGTYDFTHALIRHALYEELSTPRRLLLHRRIGEALEQLYADDLDAHVAELAHHFYEAGVGADLEKAIDYCDRAGVSAMANVAYDDAVTHYQRAAELIRAQRPIDERRLATTLLQLGLARYAAAAPSVETFIEAAEAARRAGDFHLVVRAVLRDPELSRTRPSNAPLWPVEHDRFVSLLDDALKELADERSTLRACALAYRAFLVNSAQVNGGKDLGEDCLQAFGEAEQLARDIGDPRALAYVLYWQEFMLNDNPTFNNRERGIVDELIGLARMMDDRALLRGAHMWRAFCLLRLGDPAMDEDLQAFHAMSQELGTVYASWWSSVCVAMRTMMCGDLVEAERQIIAAAAFGKDVVPGAPPETGDAVDIASTFSQQFFMLRLHQGRLPEIEGLIAGAVQQFPDIPAWRAALALAQLEAGRPLDARREYEQVTKDGIGALTSTPFFNTTLPLLCEVAAELEERSHAEELLALMLPYQHRMVDIGWRVSLGSADRYLGLLAMTMRRYDDAAQHFEDALVMTTRIGGAALAGPHSARLRADATHARRRRRRRTGTGTARCGAGDGAGDRDGQGASRLRVAAGWCRVGGTSPPRCAMVLSVRRRGEVASRRTAGDGRPPTHRAVRVCMRAVGSGWRDSSRDGRGARAPFPVGANRVAEDASARGVQLRAHGRGRL